MSSSLETVQTTDTIIVENLGGQIRHTVNNLGEAAVYLSQNTSIDWWLTSPLKPDVRAEVFGEPNHDQLRLDNGLVLDHRRFIPDRGINKAILKARIAEPTTTLFGRGGIAFVHLSPDVPAIVRFSVNRGHGLDEAQLDGALMTVSPLVSRFMADIMGGKLDPRNDASASR